MIKARKYDYGSGAVKRKFDLSSKERSRASEDGVAIVTRQQQSGTYGVFAIDINTGFPVGNNWYEVSDQLDVPRAITFLHRDLDKFYGRGGDMSDKGRMRLKEATMNPRVAFEQALKKQGTKDIEKYVNSAVRDFIAGVQWSAEDLERQAKDLYKKAEFVEEAWKEWDVDELVRWEVIDSSQGRELKEFFEDQVLSHKYLRRH
jgi:hypothetical protein